MMPQKTFGACMLLMLLFAACKKNDNNDNTTAGIEIAKASYVLPGDSLYPEGIVYAPQTGHFYVGSVSSGDILKVDAQSGAASPWAGGAAQGRKAANGLKLDGSGRLWISGGVDAKVSVLDANGGLLQRWDLKAMFGAAFINDCIISDSYVYFTDSKVQKMYRAPLAFDSTHSIEEWLSFTDAQIPYVASGTNANGIVLTPDGKYLIIVVSTTGKLYRITIADKSIAEITLNTPVTAGDGMLLEGSTLYVSRNAINMIFPVTLSADFLQGNVGTGFGNGLLFPTTLARAKDYLLVVNGQLDRRATKNPSLPFTVSRISVP